MDDRGVNLNIFCGCFHAFFFYAVEVSLEESILTSTQADHCSDL